MLHLQQSIFVQFIAIKNADNADNVDNTDNYCDNARIIEKNTNNISLTQSMEYSYVIEIVLLSHQWQAKLMNLLMKETFYRASWFISW